MQPIASDRVRKYRVAHCAIVASVFSAALTGCSEKGIQTVPVYGNITFADREPPPTCDVIFQPQKSDGPMRPSFTDRKPDGSYQVKAFKNSKGLVPGTYRIQLVFHDLKPGADPKQESSWKITKYDGGEIQVESGSGGVEHNIEVRTKQG